MAKVSCEAHFALAVLYTWAKDKPRLQRLLIADVMEEVLKADRIIRKLDYMGAKGCQTNESIN